MSKREKDAKDPSLQAEAVVGAGRGALIVAMFGAGWLGWGLGLAHAFTGRSWWLVGPVFGAVALLLWIGSMYTIRKGRLLRKQYPPLPPSTRRAVRRSFFIVVLIEVLALAFVFILSSQIHRPDLGADWAAIVVGLHFLPLARLFRSTGLGIIGILITLWCVICWALFRSDALVISVSLGTGTLLWLASVSALFRGRKVGRSFS
jgi:hypothetical protein